ncbi:MAG: radical SAM protein [Lewinellaceae bacterium]|nr:radical SAM protein [Saprospiraceae bacterium]MCB9313752.1 radical SAM protein [Lewinellaceae bacterium]HRW75808.1 radical SAM protein [Saprospiraceae bacterium]
MGPVYLITPPFTQLNTPYPATAYLKGFLNTRGIPARQDDLGIEVILRLFSQRGLTDLFDHIAGADQPVSENSRRIIALRDTYIRSIDAVIAFLQGRNPTLAHRICQDHFLPEASRFAQLDDLEWAFGALGIQDQAKHLATLYLEDLSDLIQECVDPHFGFSRYAERLGRCASTFDEIHASLQAPYTYIDTLLIDLLEERMAEVRPGLVAISVPFPGNLYAGFRCAQWIKAHYPDVPVAMGGGFANTELRSLSDPRVFDFFDFITLDDGEAPLEHLVEHLAGKRPQALLKRTFVRIDGQVDYLNFSLDKDYKQEDCGTPDYSDLPLDRYISVLEVANPMHRMWSDGRWNKLTMAHGCYWGKCTFCDISLDYIQKYEPLTAALLCDRMEEMITATGETGFHFVDEAAPPALMRELALEILRRKLTVTWWTNIRFEKSFTRDLCRLLRASGCIGVSGGLEVASDRLLDLIQKGVSVAQVARVTRNFTEQGIMVHAYLMYAFPTQTVQETVDSLEMVRQLFEAGVIQSGFWHQFAMTAHSPVGLDPAGFGVEATTTTVGTFANNDMDYVDATGIDHDRFSYGLKKSLLNFMHGIGFDFPLQDWFDFPIPETSIPQDYIQDALHEEEPFKWRTNAKVVWLGGPVSGRPIPRLSKKDDREGMELTVHDLHETYSVKLPKELGQWLIHLIPRISGDQKECLILGDIASDADAAGLADLELLWEGREMRKLRERGLVVV